MSLFPPVCEVPARLPSKRDTIATLDPTWARPRTSTSGYFIQCALIRDFVSDSGALIAWINATNVQNPHILRIQPWNSSQLTWL